MKTMKKMLLVFVFALVAFLVVACKPKTKPIEEETTKHNTYQEVKEGFTDLNQLTKDGKPASNGILPFMNSKRQVKLGNQLFTLKSEYKKAYVLEVSNAKFNYLKDTQNWNKEVYANMVDALMSTDRFGNIIGELAIGKKVFKNANKKTVIQYQIRKNVPWVVNKTGEVYEKDGVKQYVTAHDFVSAAKYVLKSANGSPLAPQYKDNIVGAEEFYEASKENKEDLSKLGVKAVADDIIEYTLLNDINYFDSLLTFSCFLPVNEKYLEEVGSKFGESADNILVNGPFRVQKHEKEAEIVFVKNAKYWDLGHVYFETMKWIYVAEDKPTSTIREMFEAGKIDSFGLLSTDEAGYKKYVGNGNLQNPENPAASSVRTADSTTFYGLFNFNRKTYEYPDASQAQTEKQKQDTKKAIWNTDLRLGFLYGMKVETFLQSRTKSPYERVYRRLTAAELGIVRDGDKTKDYTDYVDELYNEKNGTSGVKLSGFENGSDPIFNETKAKEYFKKAYDALKAAGVDFPVKIDTIGERNVVSQTYSEKMFRELEELAIFEGKKLFEIQTVTPQSDSQNQDWIFETHNYDLNLSSGWSPDYADPKTFLNTIVQSGDIVENMGFGSEDPATKQLEKELLEEYTKKAKDGFAETEDIKKRFRLMAEAEYYAIFEKGLILPIQTRVGYAVVVGKTLPYTVSRAQFGISNSKLKNLMVSENNLTREERNNLRALFYEQKEGKKIENSTITFEGVKGWKTVTSITGEKGTVAKLPRPFQDLTKEGTNELINPADRLEFDGWYLDKEFKKPVQKDKDGKYVFPNENTTYYLRSKKYVSPELELKNAFADPKADVLNQTFKTEIKRNPGDELSVSVYQKFFNKEANKVDWKLVNNKTVATVLDGNELTFAALKYGVFKVVVKAHQHLEGDKFIEITITNKQTVNVANELKNVTFNQVATGSNFTFNVEKDPANPRVFKATAELTLDKTPKTKNNTYRMLFGWDIANPTFAQPGDGDYHRDNGNIRNAAFSPNGFLILVKEKGETGKTTYKLKFHHRELIEETGEFKVTTFELTLEINIK